MIGDADSAQRAFLDEFLDHRHVHRGRHGVVRPVDLQDVDVVGLQVLQRALEGGAEIVGNQTISVGLGRENVFIPISAGGFQRVAQSYLGN